MINPPDNTGNKQEIIRDEEGKFLPGQSGNPRGKPKGSLSITARLKTELKKKPNGQKSSFLEVLVKTILKKALQDQDKDMIKTIWQFIDGTPRHHIDMGVDDDDIKEIKIAIIENKDKKTIVANDNQDK